MSEKNINFNDKKIRKSTFYKTKKYVVLMTLVLIIDNVFYCKNKQLFKKHTKIWETIEKLMKINFESKPVYGDHDKYIKTKIKMYAGSIITNFHNKKMPKEKAPCKCLSIIMIDSVIKANKKYYPQTLLEECKYIQEKIKIENYIDEDLENSESDSDFNNETESDNDNDDDNDDE